VCRKASRHFVAMEGDKEIFKAILESLIVDTVTEDFKKQRFDVMMPLMMILSLRSFQTQSFSH
jgi:hypothetical protein